MTKIDVKDKDIIEALKHRIIKLDSELLEALTLVNSLKRHINHKESLDKNEE